MRSVTPSHGLSNVGKSLGNRSVKLINSLQVKRYDGTIEQSFFSKNSISFIIRGQRSKRQNLGHHLAPSTTPFVIIASLFGIMPGPSLDWPR